MLGNYLVLGNPLLDNHLGLLELGINSVLMMDHLLLGVTKVLLVVRRIQWNMLALPRWWILGDILIVLVVVD